MTGYIAGFLEKRRKKRRLRRRGLRYAGLLEALDKEYSSIYIDGAREMARLYSHALKLEHSYLLRSRDGCKKEIRRRYGNSFPEYASFFDPEMATIASCASILDIHRKMFDNRYRFSRVVGNAEKHGIRFPGTDENASRMKLHGDNILLIEMLLQIADDAERLRGSPGETR